MPDREKQRAIALALAALAIGLAYVCGGFVPRHEWLLAPAAALGIVAAFGCGLLATHAASPMLRLASAFAWSVAFLAVMALPAGARWGWLWSDAVSIPVPADATNFHRTINVVRWDETEPFTASYATALSAEKTDEFLTREFTARGWQVLVTSEPQQFHALAKQILGMKMELRGKIELHGAYTLRRGRRFVQVYVLDDGSKRWVYVAAFPDEAPRALRSVQR